MKKRIAVFCGSAEGKNPIYHEHAKEIGAILAKNGIELVYGGGGIGMMGLVATSVLSHSGKVIGVIPTNLHERELAHKEITELHVVSNMHERKMKMYELSDAFLILPGGIGTLDEFFEVYTWSQLGIHHKECFILNSNGIYSHLLHHLKKITDEGFLDKLDLDRVVAIDTPKDFEKKVLPAFLQGANVK